MRTSDINDLASSLSLIGRDKFLLFLDARYFHGAKNTEPHKALACILFEQFDAKLPELSDDETYTRLFRSEVRVPNKLEKLRSETIGFLRQFITQNHFQETHLPSFDSIAMTQFSIEKGLQNHAARGLAKLQQSYEEIEPWAQSQNEMLNTLLYHGLLVKYTETFELKKYSEASAKLREGQESFFIRNHLHSLLLLLNYLRTTGGETSETIKEVESLLTVFKDAKYVHSLAGSIQYNIAALLVSRTDPDITKLQMLFEQLKKAQEVSDVDWIFTLMKMLQNLTNRSLAHIELDNLGWAIRKYIYENDPELSTQIHENEFTNTVIIALRHKEIEWTAAFIARMKDKIIGDAHAEDAYNLALAYLHMARMEWEPCIDLLNISHFIKPQHKALARTMEVIAYYELESVLLEPKLEALKVSLFREKGLSDVYKKSCNHFVDLTKRLVAHRYHGNKSRIQKILDEVLATHPVHHRSWLQRKVSELLQ